MNNSDLDALASAVLGRIFVELEASGRHVHVTKEQAQTLFGHGLTPKRPLSQPGQFLCQERLTVVGPKGRFEMWRCLVRSGRRHRWKFP
jgi:putative phosphotransacetylase